MMVTKAIILRANARLVPRAVPTERENKSRTIPDNKKKTRFLNFEILKCHVFKKRKHTHAVLVKNSDINLIF